MQGITIRPLVEFLDVKKANKKQQAVSEEIHSRVGPRGSWPGERGGGSVTRCDGVTPGARCLKKRAWKKVEKREG